MNNGITLILIGGLGLASMQCGRAAESSPAPQTPPAPGAAGVQIHPGAANPNQKIQIQPSGMGPMAPAAPLKPVLKDMREDMSYALGMNMGTYIKRQLVDLDLNVVFEALKDAAEGRNCKLTEKQEQDIYRAYSNEARTKIQAQQREQAEKNKKLGDAFLAENKSKPGVKTHSMTLRDGKTTGELQYKVITDGTGAMPKPTDLVTINYKGTLIDGKEFDNSNKHGTPTKTPASRFVPGFSEALTLMKAGSKWEIYLPAVLAYGDRPAAGGQIEPGSTLIFEVELVSVEPAPAAPAGHPAPAKPLTSDIIKVPSKEEISKGAKPEVIKAEDLDKKIQAEKAQAK